MDELDGSDTGKSSVVVLYVHSVEVCWEEEFILEEL
jgi:hypothetical protein